MLGNDVLMARALRWAVDEHDLTVDALKTIPGPLKTKLMDLRPSSSFYLNSLLECKLSSNTLEISC